MLVEADFGQDTAGGGVVGVVHGLQAFQAGGEGEGDVVFGGFGGVAVALCARTFCCAWARVSSVPVVCRTEAPL
nr:hypothetical protein [Streptomyces sp. ID38640]